MKKIMFLFGFLFVAGMTMNAQTEVAKKSCSKTCAKKCTKMAAVNKDDAQTKVASVVMTADEAAAADENIEKRVCTTSGKTSYYQKSVCAQSGNVSWAQVEYDTKSNKFTKVASASAERSPEEAAEAAAKDDDAPAMKKSCSKSCAKKCSKKK
jgi:hypothetical protein